MGRTGGASDATADTGAGALFRPDIEGLRGVAILLVLLFHGAFPVPGGFVGVDVFFVISGFLITGLLLRERETTGGIGLLAFYGRRMRRLLPAAVVVIAVVMPLAFVVLPPLDRPGAMADGAAAVLCTSNIRSALAAGDYFAAVSTPSPFLHFWSLSLEEQFYLVWPVLLLLVARGRRIRLAAGIVLVVLLVAGLGASVLLTDRAATWGFYSLPSRSWQFAAGGLVAVGAVLLRRLPDLPAALGGWAGIVAIAAAALAIDGGVPYPGVAALLPTAGAVLLIIAGDRPRGPGVLLRIPPLRFLGRISYSLYLWHWPIQVLAIAAIGTSPDPAGAAALAVIAIGVGWLSWAFVEEPFRKARLPRRTLTRLSLPLGTGAIVGVVAWSAMLGASADAAIAGVGAGAGSTDVAILEPDDGPAIVGGVETPTERASGTPATSDAPATETPAADATGSTEAGPTDPSSSTSAPSGDATVSAAAAPTADALIAWDAIPAARLPADVRLPRDVRPALGEARDDRERLPDDGCFTWLDGVEPAECVYGKARGRIKVVLVGDSHAGHWFPAFNALAQRNGWQLLPYVKASCPFIDIPVQHPFAKREFTECATWRTRAIRAINGSKPDLVVVATAYRGIRPVNAADGRARTQGEAMAREIAKLEAPAAIMVDSPRTSTDVPACLSKHPDDIHACAIRRGEAFFDTFGVRERVAAKRSGAAVIDIVAAVCPSTPCPVVLDGMIVYRDGHHLTATFARSLAPVLMNALRPIPELAGPPPAPAASAAPASAAPAAVARMPSASAEPAVAVAARTTPASAPTPLTLPLVTSATSGAGATDPSVQSGAAAAAAAAAVAAVALRSDVQPASRGAGALEPVVAAHPTDAHVLAVAYERRLGEPACSGAALEAAVAVSRDGGRTWRETKARPWDGSGRASSYHSAVAWGPGPAPGAARLYWAGTTTRRCGGDLRVAVAWSDDEGATWGGLHVFTATPAWVGGMPDITADRDPASPGFGTLWVVYNYPLSGGRGSGVRVTASSDFGRTWSGIAVPRVAAAPAFPASWRFGYRIRTGPDGSAWVSWYQADLRHWDPAEVFERGSHANVGRIGFAVARVRREDGRVIASKPVMPVTVSRNAWTLGDRAAPGTRSHTYVDPMWSHGLDVDPLTGDLHLAVGDFARSGKDRPAGSIRVGRSSDGGRTWTWTVLQAPPETGGRAQSVFRPGIVARDGVVVVGMRTIDRVAGPGADARIGAAWAMSTDGGRSFTRPAVIPGSRWRSSGLAAWVNGPGTRDRLDIAADGTAIYAYGVGRDAMTARSAAPGTVQVARLRPAALDGREPLPPYRGGRRPS